MNRLAVVRAAYGVFLLVASRTVVERVTGERSSVAATVGRIIGARHLVQAFTLGRLSGGWLAAGAAIDGLHALSMVVLAALSHKYRRLAALNAAVAGVWTASGWLSSRR